jgi:hypothetical protein
VSVKVICEYFGSIVDVYGVLESCGSVIVVCECCGSVINMYGVLKNCGSVIVICEYNKKCGECVWG